MSKEIYVPVDGLAHKVTKIYAPVNGVARSVKKVYKGVNGIARQVFEAIPPIKTALADNTWESIIYACQFGLVPDTWAVGDQFTMTIGGTDYLVDIIGKNHDDYADGSGKAPLTFQLHDLYATEYAMNADGTNSVGWANCDMRLTHLPSVLSQMPKEVQAGIREVAKMSSTGSQRSSIVETHDKLFLLSEVEIMGTSYLTFEGEGERYAYYLDKDHRKKMHLGGSNAEIWLGRSPNRVSNVAYYCIGTDGGSNRAIAEDNHAIAPAFCF